MLRQTVSACRKDTKRQKITSSKTFHRNVLEITNANAEQRGGGLVRLPSKCCRISHPLLRFLKKGDFAACERRQGWRRPLGSIASIPPCKPLKRLDLNFTLLSFVVNYLFYGLRLHFVHIFLVYLFFNRPFCHSTSKYIYLLSETPLP